MKQLSIKPTIHKFTTAQEFVQAFQLNSNDLVITNEYIWQPYFSTLNLACDVIFQEHYGKGEPTDTMVDAIVQDIRHAHRRVIGIGGGTVMDIAKVCSLKQTSPLVDLVDGKIPVMPGAQLILVPTTCGTGSEVTNIAVFTLTERNTKKGLAHDACYPTDAVLIPELLHSLPHYVFATSSLDALTHAIESALSPNASDLTRMFSYQACKLILNSYLRVKYEGASARQSVMDDLVSASLYAGIAFGNAGCGCVHAMAYPLGGTFHIAHGETNAALLTSVLRYYQAHDTNAQFGQLTALCDLIASILECSTSQVFNKLDELIHHILPQRALHEYGMTEHMIDDWAHMVVTEQQRLLKNSYIPMNEDAIRNVYRSAY